MNAVNKEEPFGIYARLRSLRCAFKGVELLLRTQHNAWIHAVATGAVVFLGFFFRVTRDEWIALTLAATLVWFAEALNTALEFLADALHAAHHPGIGKAKDIAAGAVLLAALGATITGLIVFVPYLTH